MERIAPECSTACPKCKKHEWEKIRISGDFYKFICLNDEFWKFVAPDGIVDSIAKSPNDNVKPVYSKVSRSELSM